jgi:hypothetical protein
MTIAMKRKLAILLLGLDLALIAEAGAQASRTLDAARMQRDVEIMEMVLDRLLNREAGRMIRLGGVSARGTYIPGFGVLFQIPNASPFMEIYEMRERRGRATFEGKAATGRGTETDLLNEELWEFFSRYADAIGQLSDEDRVAVYSEAGSEFSFFFEITGEQARSFTSQPAGFLAWMSKGDIAALRAGKLGENEFRERMRTVKQTEDDADLEIMSGILDKLTANRTGTAHGFYLPDYGAIFFTEAGFAHSVWSTRAREQETASPVETYRQIEAALRAARTVEQEREKNWQDEYKKFRGKIAEAFADYGHTLRRLKPEDRLVVTTDFRFSPQGRPRGLVCQIKKQQLDSYNAGKISREQLLRSVAYFEN